MSKDTGGPAFPFAGSDGHCLNDSGMTLRQYAAIKLKVPDSGLDWLDEMIRKSARDDFAAKAVAGCDPGNLTYEGLRVATLGAFKLADAMLAERAK